MSPTYICGPPRFYLRNASKVPLGLNRPGLPSDGVVFARLFSFNSRFASRLIYVETSRAAEVFSTWPLAASARQQATARPLHPNTDRVAPRWSDVAAVPATKRAARLHLPGAGRWRSLPVLAAVRRRCSMSGSDPSPDRRGAARMSARFAHRHPEHRLPARAGRAAEKPWPARRGLNAVRRRCHGQYCGGGVLSLAAVAWRSSVEEICTGIPQ